MIASKPFVARGSRIERCPHCLLAPSVCICDFKVSYHAKADFLLLIHHDEEFKPTNTGRLIEDCISGTRRFKWSRTEPADELLQLLHDPDIDPYIVFPDTMPITHESAIVPGESACITTGRDEKIMRLC